jgi:hypothetical protein
MHLSISTNSKKNNRTDVSQHIKENSKINFRNKFSLGKERI